MKKYIYIVVLVIVVILISVGLYYRQKTINLLNKSGRYTIATIEKIEPSAGKGCSYKVYASYSYMDKKYETYECISYTLDKSYIGKRCFLKFAPKNIEDIHTINYDCSVPDSISAPKRGWSQEWMKNHFPDCMNATVVPKDVNL